MADTAVRVPASPEAAALSKAERRLRVTALVFSVAAQALRERKVAQ